MNRPALIIGYGNRLRGDDGLGPAAAERIAEMVSPDEAQVIIAHQLTPELAEDISEARLAVFIDASVEVAPGEIARCELEVAADEEAGPTTHHVSPRGLLITADALYGRSPEGVMFSVGAASLDFGEVLSEEVAAALPQLLAHVRETLRPHCPAS